MPNSTAISKRAQILINLLGDKASWVPHALKTHSYGVINRLAGRLTEADVDADGWSSPKVAVNFHSPVNP